MEQAVIDDLNYAIRRAKEIKCFLERAGMAHHDGKNGDALFNLREIKSLLEEISRHTNAVISRIT